MNPVRLAKHPALLLCLLSTLASPGRGEAEEVAPRPEWEFSLAPYLWASALEGTAEAKDQTADIDVSFSDIWDELDAGALAAFEARRGRFSVVTNAIYLKLSPEASQPTGGLLPIAPPGSFEVRATMEEILFELRAAWEVVSLPLFGAADERRIALDFGSGARAVWLASHLDVKLDPAVPVGPFQRRFDERIFWVDLLAAARVRARLNENVGLVVSGDYGGFDIGSSSHRTWSLAGFLSYRLGEHWDLSAGWRTLEIERGAVDLEMAGPLLGASYRF